MTAPGVDAVMAGLAAEHPRPGTLYGIGVGPGDPALVTVAAAFLLGRLDLVAVPRSSRGTGVAGHAVAPYVDPDRTIELVSDMPDDPGAVEAGWRRRVAPILEALDAGRTVGFATDGDPALYSTFGHVAGAVRAARPETPMVVIPGVPAMCAAAAAGGFALAGGADRLCVLPASRVGDPELEAAVAAADSVVLLKLGGAIDRARALLVAGGARGWEVHYARRVGLPDEEHASRLDGLADPGDYMALAVLRRPRPAPGEVHQ